MVRKLIWYVHFCLPIIFKYVFDILYTDVLSEQYSYFGSYLEVNPTKQFISWAVLCVILVGMLKLQESFLKSFYRVMLYFSIIPSLSLYGLKNTDNTAFALVGLYWILMLWSIFLVQRCRTIRRSVDKLYYLPNGNENYIWLIFLWSFFTTIYFSGTYSGFRYYIDFNDVYIYRNLIEVSSIVRYIFAWNTRIFLPFLIYIFLSQKHYFRFLICFILMILSYGLFGNKDILFMAFLVVGVYILFRIKLENLVDIMVAISLLVYQLVCLLFPVRKLLGLAHRFLVVPAEAHYYYYDFFQTHELLYLRQSILRHIFDSPYELPVYSIIGRDTKYYFASDGVSINNANNGLFSDAYQNFDIVGVVIYPMIIVATLYILFKSMKGLERGIQFIILLMSAWFLIGSSYFSWLISGGILILMFMLRISKKGKRIRAG